MRKSGWKTSVVALTSLAMLAACAQGPQQEAKAPRQSKRVSPAQVEAPVVPPGTFDQAKAQSELAAAQAARKAGNSAQARVAAEAAIRHWPGDPTAWEELEANCQASADQSCRQYAAFFHAKVDYAKTLPARAAMLGFQNIAEEPVGTKATDFTYDQRAIDTARSLWSFYSQQNRATVRLETAQAIDESDQEEEEQAFAQRYPYLVAIGLAGAVAGVITGIKSLANK